jgi:hypothetical protein
MAAGLSLTRKQDAADRRSIVAAMCIGQLGTLLPHVTLQ